MRPWRRAAVCVVLRDRAAAEPVVEQGNTGRDAAQQARHLALGSDEAAAAQASPGELARGPRKSPRSRVASMARAGMGVSAAQSGQVM